MDKLEKYEAMQRQVKEQYEDTLNKMEVLKTEGKVKSVTYRQLMANKIKYSDMLSLYDIFGL